MCNFCEHKPLARSHSYGLVEFYIWSPTCHDFKILKLSKPSGIIERGYWNFKSLLAVVCGEAYSPHNVGFYTPQLEDVRSVGCSISQLGNVSCSPDNYTISNYPWIRQIQYRICLITYYSGAPKAPHFVAIWLLAISLAKNVFGFPVVSRPVLMF